VPAYRFWADYFRGAFAEAGHVCLEAPGCDWAEGLRLTDTAALGAWRSHTWERTVSWLRQEHARQPVDFFLGYLFPHQVLPPAIAELRGLGIPCVNFFCDNVREFRRIPESFHCFDLHWVPEHKAVPLYRHSGLPVLHAPMPCWVPPGWRRPVTAAEEIFPPGFVGTRDLQRENLFSTAIALGLKLELRGTGWDGSLPPTAQPTAGRSLAQQLRKQADFITANGWAAFARKCLTKVRPDPEPALDFRPYARPSPNDDDYWRVIRGSQVCIGVNRYPSLRFPFDRPDTYSRLRDVEAPMAGACYLTEWTEGIGELYDLGTEIETYRTPAELSSKVAELSADQPRRMKLRAAGQHRALCHHTIARTVDSIAGRLGAASGR